jgi:hypothetical protein
MTVDTAQAANRRTLLLVAGFVALVGLIAWPSFVGRMHYARTRAEIAAIRDAASGAELSAVGKLFTTLPRLIGPAVVRLPDSLPWMPLPWDALHAALAK